MKYIDLDALRGIDVDAFRAMDPFPWTNPKGFLRDEAFDELTSHMPDVSLFESHFGYARKNEQAEHRRYTLEYEKGLDIPPVWDAFVAELLSPEYRHFVTQIMGTKHVGLRLHWHYTPAGCDVSPHCDSKIKLGSQIFYLNTHDDWDSAWGGQTVILDDHGRFAAESNPSFEDFDREWVADTMDNRSVIFGRKNNSWHGVRAIDAPEGKLRKVFIVVYENADPRRMFKKQLKRFLTGKTTDVQGERGWQEWA